MVYFFGFLFLFSFWNWCFPWQWTMWRLRWLRWCWWLSWPHSRLVATDVDLRRKSRPSWATTAVVLTVHDPIAHRVSRTVDWTKRKHHFDGSYWVSFFFSSMHSYNVVFSVQFFQVSYGACQFFLRNELFHGRNFFNLDFLKSTGFCRIYFVTVGYSSASMAWHNGHNSEITYMNDLKWGKMSPLITCEPEAPDFSYQLTIMSNKQEYPVPLLASTPHARTIKMYLFSNNLRLHVQSKRPLKLWRRRLLQMWPWLYGLNSRRWVLAF